jgi:co-chaperonin GroES (HSP10)
MAKINIQPFPGKMLVKPLDEYSPIANHIMFRGGKIPAKGKIVRLPKPIISVGQEKVSPSLDAQVQVKEGDIVFYENNWIWEFEIGGEIYHLISAYDIVAKIG